MRTRLLIALAVLASAFLLNACGGGSSTMITPTTPTISVDSITPSAKSVEQGQQQSLTFTATISGDTTNGGVFWGASCSVAQCGTITSTSPLSAMYVPPSGTLTASLTVTITATSNVDHTKQRNATVTVVPVVSAPQSASTPTTATIGSAINLALVSPGTGTPPFNLVVGPPASGEFGPGDAQRRNAVMRSGSGNCSTVPAWLNSLFNPSTGAISGMVPTSAMDFHCSVAVTDSAGMTSPSVTVQIMVPIVLQAGTLPGGQQGESNYSASLASFVEGGSGTYSFSFSSSAPAPAGLALAANGSISGSFSLTATSPEMFTAQVIDADGSKSTNSYNITVAPAPVQVSVDSVTSSATQIEQGQQPLTLTAAVSGDPTGAGVTFTVSCQVSQCGIVTPSPTSSLSATYAPPTGTLPVGGLTVMITATSNKDTTKSKSVAIGAVQALAVSASASAPVTANINGSINLALVSANTGAPPFSLVVGPPTSSASRLRSARRGNVLMQAAAGSCNTLPAWLASLFSQTTGAISGTVPASAMDFDCGIAITDSLGVTSPSVTVQIMVPILLQAGVLPSGQQGESAYSASLSSFVLGGSGSSSFSGSLPAGLTLTPNGSISGSIGLTATSPLSFTALVTDADGTSASQTYSITVAQTVQISVDSVMASAPQIEQGQQPLTLTAVVSGDPSAAGVTFSITCAVSQCGTVTPSPGSNLSATYAPPAGTLTASVPVTVKATSNADPTKSNTVTITAVPALAISAPAASSLTATIGNPYNLTVQTATGTGFGAVTWAETTGNLAKVGLTLSSSGTLSASQVPGTATTQHINLQATDSLGITANLAVTITVPIKIDTTTLPSAEPTQPSYSATLVAQGGTGTYSWNVSAGSLPSGLTLAANGSISGSPSSGATTQTFTVQVTDSSSASMTQQLTLTISPQLTIAAPSPSSLLVNIGSSFSLQLSTNTGTGVTPFTWGLAGGSTLPVWLTLSPGGLLAASSVPTSANTVQFTVQVTDAAGATATLPLSLTVEVKILTTSLPTGEQTQPAYTATLSAAGGSGNYTWSNSGALPAGLTLSPTGSISGSPAANAASQTFTALVSDSTSANNSANQMLTITINPAVTISAPSQQSLAAGIGSSFSLQLSTNNGTGVSPFTWGLASGSTLPGWLTLSPSGLLSAASVPISANTAQFTVQVTDGDNVTASLPLTVTVPLKITTASLPQGEQTQASYTASIAAQGGSGTYTFTISSGALPAGLTLAANGSISGSPAANAATQTFTVQVTDSTNVSTTQQLTITINPQVAITTPSAQSLSAAIGNSFSLQLTTNAGTGVGPFTWALANSSTLPSWLTLSPAGLLSAALVPMTANTAQFTVKVTDEDGVTASLTLAVTIPLSITTTSLPSGEQTQASYSATVAAQGGSGSYLFMITDGSLPAGLTLAANGSISGSPAANAATQTFTVKVTDSANASTNQQFMINIVPQVAITAPSAQSLSAAIGSSFALQLATNTGTGVGPFTWALANGSALPAWLSLSPGGLLSATSVPTSAINSQFTVKVTDADNVTASLPLTLTVPLKITTSSLPSAEQMQASYSATVAAQGGSGTYSFSVATGSLPAGLTLAANGSISGTPAANATTQMFTVQVTDTNNATATQQFTISINPQVAIAAPSQSSLTAAIGGAFNLQLSTSAGTGVGPFTWSLGSGSTLPVWLTLSPSGLLSATLVPTSAINSQFTVKVTDAANVTAALPLTVTVPIKITTTSLPAAEQTQASYGATVTAQGGSGTYSFMISAGSLPAGLNLAPNGSISGTPSANATTQTFTVQATDSTNATATQQFTISINPQVAIAAPSAQSLVAAIGNSFSLQLATVANTGVGPFTWSLANGSIPPAWVTLSPGGLLSATSVPTTANTATFTVQVTDSANVTNTLPLTLTVPIKIVTPATLPTGEQTQASYSTTLAAQGGTGTYSWVVAQGSLPAGLALATNGSISGSPAANATTQTFTVQVTDSGSGSTSQQFTITISLQVAIAAPSAQSLTASIGATNFSLQLATSANTGIAPFTWAVASGSTLPAWLNLSSAGVLSAAQVPTTANTAQFTVQVKDSVNATASLPLVVTVPINILSTSLSAGEVTLAYSNPVLTAQGGSGTYTWSATGLPNGLSINPATGAITGTPTAATPAQGQSVTVKVTDSLNATATQQFTLIIYPVVTVNTSSLPSGTVGTSYNGTLSATGGLAPYSNWQVSNGSLPGGLSLNQSSGIISGTPACPAGTATFSVMVQDFLNVTSAAQQFSITTISVPLTISTTSLPGDLIGTAYSQQLQSNGGCGNLTWSVATGSSLPGWLQLSSSGLLTGKPGAGDAGTDSFTVQVTDGTTTAMQAFTIVVTGGFNVSGTITLVNGGGPLQGAVVSLGTNLNATTDASGNFTIAHVVAGTYTATLGFPTAPSSAFYPASANITNTNGTFTITVTNSDLTGVNFSAALGFTVSGTLTYGGTLNPAKLNRIFIRLLPSNCNNCPIPGTSAPKPTGSTTLTSPFSIQGVPPGVYTLQAWMDYEGYGIQNAFDPAGTGGPVTVSVGTGNVTNAAITITDSNTANVSLPPPPSLQASPIDQGVIIQYQPILDSNGVEQPLKYNLQWSTTDNATCETFPDGGFLIDPGSGNGGIIAGSGKMVILDSANNASPNPSLIGYFQNGTKYFICMQGLKVNPAVGFEQGGWNVVNPPVVVGAPTGSPGTNTVSGNITIPDSVSPGGPLYAGCYDNRTGKLYSTSIEATQLVTASQGTNPYSVAGVPTGAACFMFAMLDQDADGFIGPSNPSPDPETEFYSTIGDVYNTDPQNPTFVTIAGNSTQDVDLTPFANNSSPTVGTQHVMATDLSSNTQESYSLNFVITPIQFMPIKVSLLSGPNVIAPADFAICTTCGYESEFNITLSTNGVKPQVGDSYVLEITYSDPAVLPDVVTLTVTGVSDAFATSLRPIGLVTGMTTPTFSWTDPSSASNYSYQFLLSDSTGNPIWQIPGVNAFSNFFPSSIVSVPWVTPPSGKDPTGAVNPPTVASLTSGATYTWSITVQDSNSNSAVKKVAFQP